VVLSRLTEFLPALLATEGINMDRVHWLLLFSVLAVGCSNATSPQIGPSTSHDEPAVRPLEASADATTPPKAPEIQLHMTLPAAVPADEPDLLIAKFTLRNGSNSLISFSVTGPEHQETLIRVLNDSLMRVPTSPGAGVYMRRESDYDTSADLVRIEPGQEISWEKDVSKCYTLSEGGYLVRAYVDIFSYEAPQPFSRTISSNAVGLDITPASNKSVQQIRLE
jgi:hypothetical protein